MSKTIIALSTAEQLASTIPDWQQYNIQSENVPDHLSRFQTPTAFCAYRILPRHS